MIQKDIQIKRKDKFIMYKCKQCDSITPMDYFFIDGETCLDCVTEEQESESQYEIND